MLNQPSGESIRLSISFLGTYAPHHPIVKENRSIRFSPPKRSRYTTATRGVERRRGTGAVTAQEGGTLLVRGEETARHDAARNGHDPGRTVWEPDRMQVLGTRARRAPFVPEPEQDDLDVLDPGVR